MSHLAVSEPTAAAGRKTLRTSENYRGQFPLVRSGFAAKSQVKPLAAGLSRMH